MTDTEVRIACIQAAVATVGNPNHIQQAREYYNFVTEGNTPAVNEVEDTTIAPQGRKGNRK